MYLWNTEGNDTVLVRIQPNRNIKSVDKGGDFSSPPRGIEIFQNHDFVAALFIDRQDREGVLTGLCQPKSSLGIEGYIYWLSDLRFAGNLLDLEPWGPMKA